MELIYLWVSDYRNIENTGFKLSSNFDVKFNNNNKGYRELVIRNLTINNLLFEEKIENVHAIIGKNGAGKTNLMDLLGFNYKERKMAFNAKYFILYHMSDDIYAIEGRGFELIEPNIVNNPTVGSSLNSLNYVTEPYSLLIRKLPKKNKFEFISFLQFKEQYHRNDHIYYIKDFDHNSNFGINYSKNSVERNADSALFNRAKIDHNDINKLSMYKLITYFNNSTFKKNSKHLFNLNESVYVRVNYSIDYNDEYIDIDLKIENEKFTKILDRVSRIYTKEELKHQFILNFMEQYIYYSYASLKQFEKEKAIISNSNYKKLINETDLINSTFAA